MTWLASVVTVAPSVEPVSLAEAKVQCAVTPDDDSFDDLLTRYVAAARQHVEAVCGLALVTQTRVMRASCFADLASLPTAPVASVSAIAYLDPNGTEQALSTDIYEAVLIGLEPAIRLKVNQTWPALRAASDAVRVTAVCGYGAAGDVPEPIRQALLLTIGDWFATREDSVAGVISPLTHGAMSLLTNYRRN